MLSQFLSNSCKIQQRRTQCLSQRACKMRLCAIWELLWDSVCAMEANLPITFFSDLNQVPTESQRTGPSKCWDKHWRFSCRWCLVWIDPFSMRRHFEHSLKVTRKVCFLPAVNIKLPNYVKWNRHRHFQSAKTVASFCIQTLLRN